jgi:hypothetical protein
MGVFNERHLLRVPFLYVDQGGSSSEPSVAVVQSADRRYDDDISFLLPVYEAMLVPLASRLYCGQILTKEGAAYVPLELIEKRLRMRE